MILSNQNWLCLNCGCVLKPQPAAPDPASAITPGTESGNGQNAPVSLDTTPSEATSTIPPPVLVIKKPSKLRRLIIPLMGVLVVSLLVGGWVYASFYEPSHAPSKYIAKLISNSRGQYAGTLSFKSDDSTYSGYSLSVKFNGQYDSSNLRNPKIDLNLEGSMGTGSLGGELRALDKMLFLRIGSLGLFGSLGATISKDWYKTDLGDSITRDKCQGRSKSSGTLLGIQLPNDFPAKQTKRLGLLETIDGHRTSHFSGVLDFDKLQKFIEEANKSLSADCKLTFNRSDYNGVTAKYNLWASQSFDRLSVQVDDSKSKSHIEVTLDTQKYNQPVQISAPANAKPLTNIFGDLSGSDLGAPLSRDAQRKADLRNVKTALETYFNDTSYYPSGNFYGLSKLLVPTYIKVLPQDPKAGQSYGYIPSSCQKNGCNAYVLSATLENTKDPQAINGSYQVISAN